jgi:cytochrome c oxidase subunit 3
MLHVVVGALMLTMLIVWTALGYFGARRHSTISIAVIYWHFVTVVWVAVFATFYVSPYLLR